MNKNQFWKRLLISGLAAIQCFAFVPAAMAQPDHSSDQSSVQNVQQNANTVEKTALDQEQTSQEEPKSEPTDNVGEQVQGVGNGSPSDAKPESISNGTAISDIDTSKYGDDVLVILANSDIMIHNNVQYKAPEPITVKNGVSYVSLRTLTDRFGFKLTFDNKTKESIISSGGRELRYKIGTDTYLVDNVPTKMSGASYLQNNTFMVPLTSALKAFDMPYYWENSTKRIIVQMSSAPVAKFSVVPKEIFANETEVTVKNESYHPRGLTIVDVEWTGLESYYSDPGVHTVTLRVMDEKGVWSKPYSVNITVLKPNEAPVAAFTTDKEEYKMGELITYNDLSTDDENAIVKREWFNNKPAFFEPGEYTITLRVTDKHGASNEVLKKITITNETLYTIDEFYLVYTNVGDEYPFVGSSIANMKVIDPEMRHLQRTLYRSNSPESVVKDGILYQDKIAGKTRVLMHHKNATNRDMKLYVIAKNISDENAVVRVEHTGIAGPNPYPQQTGKMAAVRYFESYRGNRAMYEKVLKPGESTILVPELSNIPLKPGQIYTMYADFDSDNNLQYQIVALDANKDIWKSIPTLPKLDSDGTHIRGTFNNADRSFVVNDLVGDTASRLVFADNKIDTYIKGWDTMNGDNRVNAGNYGVLYHIELNRVAPNTLISFNARGGSYSGALLVNGQTVQTPNNGLLNTSNEASVVYRTGDREEKVDIWFTPAAGSSMPVNLIFTPLPKKHS
ncbi:stalk domain-containing protein [Paenibacillus marinisediminis]